MSWIHDLPYQNQTVIDYNDHYYRQRLRSLQGVDELVDQLITRLERSGKINNTFIIYTSDNGFHISQHRLPPGKTCGFEEDIRVPFILRGPGVAESHTDNRVTTHIDIAPTIFQLAGLNPRSDFDGTPMPTSQTSGDLHEHIAVEFWGRGILEGAFSKPGSSTYYFSICYILMLVGAQFVPNNTLKAVRVLAPDYNLFYSVWCNNEHELYDMSVSLIHNQTAKLTQLTTFQKTDPYQVNNLWKRGAKRVKILGHSMSKIIPRLDALLMVLKSCIGSECIKPWDTLHPDGLVSSLRDALDNKYDEFYESQPKVSFDRCVYGYEIDAEGPQHALAFRDGYSVESWV